MQTVHIAGAGAMGRLWASFLFERGYCVEFIVKNTHPWLTTAVKLTRKPDDLAIEAIANSTPSQPIHQVIIATKAYDSLDTAKQIAPYLIDTASILLIQNGLGSQQAVAEIFANKPVYACSSTDGAYIINPSEFMFAGSGKRIIGGLTPSANKQILAKWLPPELFSWSNEISNILWRKLVINAAINPLTVIYQCQNGKLLNNPEANQSMLDICSELDELGQKLNMGTENSYELARQVCIQTSKNFSSMYQDVEARRQTEIEFINGYVVKLCEQFGVECQKNREVLNEFLKIIDTP